MIGIAFFIFLEIASYLKREARKSWSLEGLEEEDNVFLIKTAAVYDEFVSKNDLVVLFLYAPWLVFLFEFCRN